MASRFKFITSPRLRPKSFIRSNFAEPMLVFPRDDVSVDYYIVLGEMETDPFLFVSKEGCCCKVGSRVPPLTPNGLICICLANEERLEPYYYNVDFLTSSSILDKFKDK